MGVPHERRLVEQLHLRAGVIDVVLAADLEAGGRERLGEGAAEHGAARVADVYGPGRVDAHELDLDRPPRPDVDVAELRAGRPYRLHLGLEPFPAQRDVDEAGRGRAGAPDRAVRLDVGRDALRDGQRAHAQRLGETQRKARREVPVLRVLRTLDRGVGDVDRGQSACALGLRQRLGDALFDDLPDQHSGPMLAGEAPTRSPCGPAGAALR